MATNPTAPQARGREKLAARRRRTLRIRQGVAAATVTLFVAFFSTIYTQMASGHDPVLSTSSSSATTTKSSSAAAAPAPSSDSSASTLPSAPSPVTTQQS